MKAVGALRVGVIFAALLAAGAAANAQAAPPPGGGFGFGGGHGGPLDQSLGPLGGKGRFWNNPAVVDKLKLTDDQRKAMDDILQQHLESLVDLRANAEKAELALRPLINADQLDEQRILSQIDQVAQARAELFKANARFLLALRTKLTPEQWKMVQDFRAEHPGPMQRWRQGGPQGGPPPQGSGPLQ
jgi:periplasmic protein CpxP/Spy